MPIYEYACKLCGHQFETSQGINDAPLKVCQRFITTRDDNDDEIEYCCGGELQKVFMNSGATFQLKGRGWTGKINRKD